jgi:hypothetical protein
MFFKVTIGSLSVNIIMARAGKSIAIFVSHTYPAWVIPDRSVTSQEIS